MIEGIHGLRGAATCVYHLVVKDGDRSDQSHRRSEGLMDSSMLSLQDTYGPDRAVVHHPKTSFREFIWANVYNFFSLIR